MLSEPLKKWLTAGLLAGGVAACVYVAYRHFDPPTAPPSGGSGDTERVSQISGRAPEEEAKHDEDEQGPEEEAATTCDGEGLFNRATLRVRGLRKLSDDHKLLFYSLYKQASEGPCTITAPPFYDFVARAKWDGWKSQGDKPKEEAKQDYVTLLDRVKPGWQAEEDPPTAAAGGGEAAVAEEAEESSDDDLDYDNLDEGIGQEIESVGRRIDPSSGMAPLVSTLFPGMKQEEENKDVFYWASHGNEDKVFEMVGSSGEVNARDQDGATALHWAVDRGHESLVRRLIKELGADVNATDSFGDTPLHFACTCEFPEVAKLLLSLGARANTKNDEGESPWDIASPEIRSLLPPSASAHTVAPPKEIFFEDPEEVEEETPSSSVQEEQTEEVVEEEVEVVENQEEAVEVMEEEQCEEETQEVVSPSVEQEEVKGDEEEEESSPAQVSVQIEEEQVEEEAKELTIIKQEPEMAPVEEVPVPKEEVKQEEQDEEEEEQEEEKSKLESTASSVEEEKQASPPVVVSPLPTKKPVAVEEEPSSPPSPPPPSVTV